MNVVRMPITPPHILTAVFTNNLTPIFTMYEDYLVLLLIATFLSTVFWRQSIISQLPPLPPKCNHFHREKQTVQIAFSAFCLNSSKIRQISRFFFLDFVLALFIVKRSTIPMDCSMTGNEEYRAGCGKFCHINF